MEEAFFSEDAYYEDEAAEPYHEPYVIEKPGDPDEKIPWGLIGIAVAVGAGIALWSRARAKRSASPSPSPSGLSQGALLGEGFDQEQTQRILSQQGNVNTQASAQALDPDFINGVIWVESKFRNGLTSPAGAEGLMQLMPNTNTWLAEQKGIPKQSPMVASYNIELGSFYLRRLLNQYDQDERKTLAAYNWGPGNVQDSPNQFPPGVEQYVTDVQNARQRFAQARQRSAGVA